VTDVSSRRADAIHVLGRRTPGTTLPYTAIGIGFAALAAFCCGYAFWRHRDVERAISRGELAHPDQRVLALLPGGAVVLGVLLVIVLSTGFRTSNESDRAQRAVRPRLAR